MENYEINTDALKETLKTDGAEFFKKIANFLEVLVSYIQQLMGTIVIKPKYADSEYVAEYTAE